MRDVILAIVATSLSGLLLAALVLGLTVYWMWRNGHDTV